MDVYVIIVVLIQYISCSLFVCLSYYYSLYGVYNGDNYYYYYMYACMYVYYVRMMILLYYTKKKN